jgi:hypothetical protein
VIWLDGTGDCEGLVGTLDAVGFAEAGGTVGLSDSLPPPVIVIVSVMVAAVVGFIDGIWVLPTTGLPVGVNKVGVAVVAGLSMVGTVVCSVTDTEFGWVLTVGTGVVTEGPKVSAEDSVEGSETVGAITTLEGPIVVFGSVTLLVGTGVPCGILVVGPIVSCPDVGVFKRLGTDVTPALGKGMTVGVPGSVVTLLDGTGVPWGKPLVEGGVALLGVPAVSLGTGVVEGKRPACDGL